MLDAARDLADRLLAPNAESVDASQLVPASHLAALADAGLFGLVGPASHGGLDADPQQMRRALATIAGGCGATFFVWAQHHGVVGAVRRARSLVDTNGGSGVAPDRLDDLLRSLCAGTTRAGTAFAYLRNPDSPGVRARPADGGWELDGVAPWVTSWGLADVFLIAAATDDGRIVWTLVEAGPDRPVDGLTASPLPLAVFGATGTVSLRLDRVRVGDDRVLLTEDVAAWRRTNRIQAAPGQPQCLGVAERCARHLRSMEDDEAIGAADRLDQALAARWDDDQAIIDALPARVAAESAAAGASDAFVEAASAHRTRCLELGRSASTVLLAASGGRGMALAHPAQRLVREAAFYVIQAMTEDGRRAALDPSSIVFDESRHAVPG